MRVPALLGLALWPGMALAVPAERIEAFVEVMAEHGCRMSPHVAGQVMPEAGFGDKEETRAITEELISAARARILDGQLVVFGGACGGKLDYSGRERFFAALADNGCSMTIDEARVMLPRIGVEMTEVQILMDKMQRMAEVRLSEDERAVFLEEGLCERFRGLSAQIMASAPVPAVPVRTQAQLREDFLAFMAGAGCRLTRAEADIRLPAAGFAVKELRPVIAQMIAEGEAVMHPEDDSLTINEEVCAR